MSRSGDRSDGPQAVIHRKILDVAETNPEASLESIAEEVSGASVDLVDRVLEEYGDPSAEQPDGSVEGGEPTGESTTPGVAAESGEDEAGAGGADGGDETVSEDDGRDGTVAETEGGDGSVPDHPQLSEDQTEALGLIARNPDATQRELATELDVTAATVSRWLNDIPGFDWGDREAFAERVLDAVDEPDAAPMDDSRERDDKPTSSGTGAGDTPSPDADGTGDSAGEVARDGGNGRGDVMNTDGDTTDEMAALHRRVDALEDRIDRTLGEEAASVVEPELLQKVIHACMASDRISEEEELRVLERLLD